MQRETQISIDRHFLPRSGAKRKEKELLGFSLIAIQLVMLMVLVELYIAMYRQFNARQSDIHHAITNA